MLHSRGPSNSLASPARSAARAAPVPLHKRSRQSAIWLCRLRQRESGGVMTCAWRSKLLEMAGRAPSHRSLLVPVLASGLHGLHGLHGLCRPSTPADLPERPRILPAGPSTGKMRPDANRTATRSGISCSQVHPPQLAVANLGRRDAARATPSEPEAPRRPPSQPRTGKRRASAGPRWTDCSDKIKPDRGGRGGRRDLAHRTAPSGDRRSVALGSRLQSVLAPSCGHRSAPRSTLRLKPCT